MKILSIQELEKVSGAGFKISPDFEILWSDILFAGAAFKFGYNFWPAVIPFMAYKYGYSIFDFKEQGIKQVDDLPASLENE